MKQFFINLAKSIKNGILRIFPRISNSIILKFLIVIVGLIFLISCSTQRQVTQVVHDIQHDTIYLSNLQYDSIFVSQDHSMEYHRDTTKTILVDSPITKYLVDTILIKDKSIEYKYKLLRDTLYKTKVDSIPVVKEVTVTKEVKYIPWYSKLLSWIGAILLITLIIYLIYRIIKWKIKF